SKGSRTSAFNSVLKAGPTSIIVISCHAGASSHELCSTLLARPDGGSRSHCLQWSVVLGAAAWLRAQHRDRHPAGGRATRRHRLRPEVRVRADLTAADGGAGARDDWNGGARGPGTTR